MGCYQDQTAKNVFYKKKIKENLIISDLLSQGSFS